MRFIFLFFFLMIRLSEIIQNQPELDIAHGSGAVCPRSCSPIQPALLPLAILNGSRGCSRGHFDFFSFLKSCFTFPIWI